MMGYIEIKTFLNIDHLGKKLEADGWTVRYVDNFAATPKRERGLAGEFMPDIPSEDFLDLSKSDSEGTYHTVIPWTLVIFVLSSYYALDFLMEAINEGFARGQREKFQRRKVTINFTGERDTLI
jgi:hypothetical protein